MHHSAFTLLFVTRSRVEALRGTAFIEKISENDYRELMLMRGFSINCEDSENDYRELMHDKQQVAVVVAGTSFLCLNCHQKPIGHPSL